jgi:DNA modification methylase
MSNQSVILDVSEKSIIFDQKASLDEIECLDRGLYQHYKNRFCIEPRLSRSLVSFQASKNKAIYRWYKFKEAFSPSLVEYLFNKYNIINGSVLDPFAGSGTALFIASARGINADGIELLLIGQEIIATKRVLEEFTEDDFSVIRQWSLKQPWVQSKQRISLNELRITKNAYPEQTKEAIEKYLGACQQENNRIQTVLRFALLCVLESISYTRKDGQYLRWDHRSGRRHGKKPFDKGLVLEFNQAICAKIEEIISDVVQPEVSQPVFFSTENLQGDINLYKGSCLDKMPILPSAKYDAIITSPPYCNRYDYTRTYALELALLGINEQELVSLRQQMLSCTVENRTKNLLGLNPEWETAITVTDHQELLQAILGYLDAQKENRVLNNNGIPRMVRGYFYEMACVIAECSRIMKPNALLFMVNDNVRYAGASISVDMILSSFAEKLGFYVEHILVLPDGKGNSSQQMSEHGRKPLRKCVYVWRKLDE